jgi:cytochrome oxidase Cu insertion factor (SCO1/SenC/PrrC family)
MATKGQGIGLAARLALAVFLCVPPVQTARILAADPALGPKDGGELPATDLERVKPGVQAPDFTLEDQNGRPITLSSFQAHVPVVLVFYRGHW